MLTEIVRLDSGILSQLSALGYSEVVIVLVLAVLLAPVIYSVKKCRKV